MKPKHTDVFEILFFSIVFSIYFWSVFNFWDKWISNLWMPPPTYIIDFFNSFYFLIIVVGLVVSCTITYIAIPKEERHFKFADIVFERKKPEKKVNRKDKKREG